MEYNIRAMQEKLLTLSNSSLPQLSFKLWRCCNCNLRIRNDPIEISGIRFARHKLLKMKHQITKLRKELRKVESENIQMRKLESSKEAVLANPSIIDYRRENIQLRQITEHLLEKIKDLEDTLIERDLYENPCEGVQMIQKKIGQLRETCSNEIKKLKDTITDLRIKLVEAEEQTSCAGINRLKKQIKELTQKKGEKVLDQNQTIGLKSIETVSEKDDLVMVEIVHSKQSKEYSKEFFQEMEKDLQLLDGIMKKRQSFRIGDQGRRINYKDSIGDMKLGRCQEELEKLQNDNLKLKNRLQSLKEESLEKKPVSLPDDGDAECKVRRDTEEDLKKDQLYQYLPKDYSSKPKIDEDKFDLKNQSDSQTMVDRKRDFDKSQKRVMELHAENLQTTGKAENLKEKIDVDVKLNSVAFSSENNFKSQFAECQDKINQLTADKLKLISDFDNLKKQNEEMRNKLSTVETTDQDEENIQLKVKLHDCQNDLDTLSSKNSDLEHVFKNLKAQYGLSQLDTSKMLGQKESKEDKNEAEYNIDKLRGINESLLKEVDDWKEKYEKLSELMNKKLTPRESLIEKFGRETEIVGETEKVLSPENAEVEDGLNELKTENKILRAEIDGWKEKYEKLNLELARMKETKDIEEKESKMKVFENSEDNYKKLENELTRRKRESSIFESERNKYLDEKNELSEELEKEKGTKDKLKEYSMTLEAQLRELNERDKSLQSELEQARQSLESTTINGEILKENLANLMSNNEDLRVSLNGKEKDLKSVQDNLNKMSSVNEELEQVVKDSTMELEQLKESYKSPGHLCEEVEKELEKVQNEKHELKIELDQIRAELKNISSPLNLNVNELQTKLENSNENIKNLTHKLEEAMKYINGLEQDIISSQDQVKLTEMKYLDWENLKLKLENERDSAEKDAELVKNQLFIEQEAKEEIERELSTLKNDLKDLIPKLDDMKASNDQLSRVHVILENDNKQLNEERNSLKRESINTENEVSKIKAENDDLKQTIERLKPYEQQYLHLHSENELLTNDIENYKLKIAEMNPELEKLKSELKTAKEYKDYADKAQKLEDELSSLRDVERRMNNAEKNLAEVTVAKDDALKEISELNDELLALKEELTKYRDQNEKLRDESEDSNSQQTILNKNLKNLRDEISALKSAHEKLQHDYDDACQDSLVLKGELQEKLDEVKQLKSHSTGLKAEYDNVQAENASINVHIEELLQNNSKLTSDLELCKADLNSCRSMNEKLEQKLKILDDENERCKTEVVALKGNLGESRNSISEQEAQLHTLKSSLEDLRIEKSSLVDEVNRLRDEIEELRSNLVNKEKQLTTAKADVVELNDLQDELHKCRQERDEHINKSETMKKQIDTLKAGSKRMSDELDEVKPEMIDLKAEKEELNLRIKHLEIQLKDLESEKKEKEVLKKSKDELEKRLLNSEAECNKLKKDADNLRTNFNAIKAELSLKDVTQRELDALKNTLASLREHIEIRDADNDRLKRELEASRNEVNKLKVELVEVLSKNEKLKAEVRNLNNEVNRLYDEVNSLRDENKQLEINIGEKLSEVEQIKDKLGSVSLERDSIKADAEKIRFDRDSLSRELDEKAKRMSDVSQGVDNWMTKAKKLEIENNRIKMELDELKRNSIEMKDTKNGIEIGNLSKDLSNLEGPLERVKNENDELKINWEKSKRDLDKCKHENEKLKSELEGIMKSVNETKAGIQSIAVVKRENENDKPKELHTKDLEVLEIEIERLQRENNTLEMNLKDLEHVLMNYKAENDILKAGIDETSKLNVVLNEMKSLRITAEDLKKENEILTDSLEIKNKELKSRIDAQKDSIIIKKDIPEVYQQTLKEDTKDASIIDQPRISDLTKAIDLLYLHMQKQIQGLSHIRENINHLKNKNWHELSRPLMLADEFDVESPNPRIRNILEQSKNLLANVVSTEKDLVNLREVWKSCWEENQKLRKLVEDLGATNVLDTTKLPGENIEGVFDPESWLNSLTITQLCDVHDRLCQLWSALVKKDIPDTLEKSDNYPIHEKNHNYLQRNYNMLNKRIAALQKQIFEKQTQAGIKVMELRTALQIEQAKFMKISSLMNQEKCRNFALYQMMEESPCLVNKCKAKCAENIKFIPLIKNKTKK